MYSINATVIDHINFTTGQSFFRRFLLGQEIHRFFTAQTLPCLVPCTHFLLTPPPTFVIEFVAFKNSVQNQNNILFCTQKGNE